MTPIGTHSWATVITSRAAQEAGRPISLGEAGQKAAELVAAKKAEREHQLELTAQDTDARLAEVQAARAGRGKEF